MSLSQALAAAISGLRASQIGMSTVAANVANAQTPGYVRKRVGLSEIAAGDVSISVQVDAINRQLDRFVQSQLRTETSGASYADLRAQFLDRLQGLYGQPGSAGSLESTFNDFMTALQGLSTSPDLATARGTVLSSAQMLAQRLNGMTSDIQALRSSAELGLADSVAKVNEALS